MSVIMILKITLTNLFQSVVQFVTVQLLCMSIVYNYTLILYNYMIKVK